MADDKTKKGEQDRNQVSGSEDYEIQYFKDTLNVSADDVKAAIKATGSNDRQVLEDYLKKQK